LIFHGGGGVKGSRKTNVPIMIKLAQAGYAAISVEYRLAPKDNAEVYNIEPDRIAAFGYSTGGQLASLLGLTTPMDGLEGEGPFPSFPSRVQVVISNSGIYDLKDWHKNGNFLARFSLNTFLGGTPDKVPEMYVKGSPQTYVRGDRAPFLLTCGSKDDLVPSKQSERMEKRLKAAGADVQLITFVGAGHNFEGEVEVEADAAAIKFLDEHLVPKSLGKKAALRK
jgi:acetyl esterase/lipase